MISIICPYNNREVLYHALLNSLKNQQGVSYELITINANEHGFLSASETLNYAGRKATGDYLIFVHQDVIFESRYVLREIYSLCTQYDFGIAGVAGCVKTDGIIQVISKIHHGGERQLAGSISNFNIPQTVDSLDECLLIIPKDVFTLFAFSDIGKTWHLYGTDYSLKMKINCRSVLVFPINFWHLSDGFSLNLNYYHSVFRLVDLYKKHFKEIITIYGTWPTQKSRLLVKLLYRELRFWVRGN